MRIVQLIDSLEVGGSERMAVNYANSLAGNIQFSGLVATRNEGLLLGQVSQDVSYLFLKKKTVIDLKAIFRFRSYLKKNQVEIIQAHSSSFFIAVLVKIMIPKIKIIWHDHYGISQDLTSRKNLVLKLASYSFLGIIAVNEDLKKWAHDYLHCPNVSYMPNFVTKATISSKSIQLKGENGKRIICVANLRAQKNHELLINAAAVLHQKFPDWTFHIVGKNFNDLYSTNLAEKVKELKLSEIIFFYGAVNNSEDLLKQSTIAVLTSWSEGLPLALLEYGLAGLPVIATNVGEIPKVIPSEKEGFVIEPNNLSQFVKSLEILIEEENMRKEMGKKLNSFVEQNFSKKSILERYNIWLNSLIAVVH